MTPADAGPDFFASYVLWKDVMLVSVISAALCSFVGVYVVLRRIVFVSAALSQVSSVGVAIAFYAASFLGADVHSHAASKLDPQYFSLLFAVGGAALFSLLADKPRLSAESVIGFGYVVGAALVVLILNSPRIGQEAHEVNNILFGNAVGVTEAQRNVLIAIALPVVITHIGLFKEFAFCSFDPESARAFGVPARLWDLLLYITIGLAIAAATRVMGALPVFAFMVLPPAAALLLTDRLKVAMALAVGIGVVSAALGYYASWAFSLPTGACMVVVAALFLCPGLLRLRNSH